MIKYLFCSTFLFFFHLASVSAQITYEEDIKHFQDELNEEYKNAETSPLEKKERRKFKGHSFFPIDSSYRVVASFELIENAPVFEMKTSTNRTPLYKKYAKVSFEIKGKSYALIVYQSQRLKEKPEYQDYLFLPFYDQTNGNKTYEGGRYIDLRIPAGNYIILDFNKAYQPYCAYNYKYSCPIPPLENNMDVAIEAGVQNLQK